MNRAALTAFVLGALVFSTGCRTRGPFEGGIPHAAPLDYRICEVSSPFGEPRSGGRRSHTGIDLRAPKNTPVLAAASGEVVYAKHWRGSSYGKVVRIDHHNGYETRYAHLHRIKAGEGDWVHAGERIGGVGKSGNATGYHLHYEVRRNGQPIDPWPYLPRHWRKRNP